MCRRIRSRRIGAERDSEGLPGLRGKNPGELPIAHQRRQDTTRLSERQLIQPTKDEPVPHVEIRGAFLSSGVTRVLQTRIVSVVIVATSVYGMAVGVRRQQRHAL